MTCEDFKWELAMALIGNGPPDEQRELEAHAKSCPACAASMEKARRIQWAIADKEKISLPDWEASWRVIAGKALRKNQRFAFPSFSNRWALAAALASIFILGAVAGKVFLFKSNQVTPSDISTRMNAVSAWQTYAESIELFLLDFGNQTDVKRQRNLEKRENELVRRLLAETRALKEVLVTEGDDTRAVLLNDVELILVGIANLRPGDKESAENMAKIVRESPLKSRFKAIVSSNIIS